LREVGTIRTLPAPWRDPHRPVRGGDALLGGSMRNVGGGTLCERAVGGSPPSGSDSACTAGRPGTARAGTPIGQNTLVSAQTGRIPTNRHSCRGQYQEPRICCQAIGVSCTGGAWSYCDHPTRQRSGTTTSSCRATSQ